MKQLAIILVTTFTIFTTAMGQSAQKDLDITSKYHINELIQKGKFHIWVTISNNSKSDYKDIIYKIDYIAADGTGEGSKNYTYHDFIGPGVSKKLKDQYLPCPKDCKSIVVSIVDGKKLD